MPIETAKGHVQTLSAYLFIEIMFDFNLLQLYICTFVTNTRLNLRLAE